MHIEYASWNVVEWNQSVTLTGKIFRNIPQRQYSLASCRTRYMIRCRPFMFSKPHLCRLLASLVISTYRNAMAHYKDNRHEGERGERRYLKGWESVRSESNMSCHNYSFGLAVSGITDVFLFSCSPYCCLFIRTADITRTRARHVTTCCGGISRSRPSSDGPDEEEEEDDAAVGFLCTCSEINTSQVSGEA